MTLVTPAIFSALADGVTAITPNRRLARQLLRDFDRVQQASGRRTWPTASVLPYATWLESLWKQSAAATVDGGPQCGRRGHPLRRRIARPIPGSAAHDYGECAGGAGCRIVLGPRPHAPPTRCACRHRDREPSASARRDPAPGG